MASMPTYHVSKGPFHILDEQFGPPNFAQAYDGVLNQSPGGDPPLGSGNAASTLMARTQAKLGGGQLTQAQASHFLNHWLGTWWPNLSVADTLRRGIVEAITCAKNANNGQGLPMEFFWVCVQDNIFQVYFSLGAQQVTVIILTPPPPPSYNRPALSDPDDLWVVKRYDNFDDNYVGLGADPYITLGNTTSPPFGTIIKQQIWHA